jgi:hypothetical protein
MPTAALLDGLAAEPYTRLRYFCSPQHTDSALFPIIGQMQRAAGLGLDDAPGVRLDKLDALLAQTSTAIEDAALIAEMLSLPNDGRYPALDLVPQERRQRTLKALVWQLEALTRSNPVLMIFEDAHWTDPTSLELFSRTVDRIRTLRVLRQPIDGQRRRISLPDPGGIELRPEGHDQQLIEYQLLLEQLRMTQRLNKVPSCRIKTPPSPRWPARSASSDRAGPALSCATFSCTGQGAFSNCRTR